MFISYFRSTIPLRNRILVRKRNLKYMKLYRPFPIDKEMKIKTKDMLVTKTDMRGNIIDINETFKEIAGYELEEIKGTAHDALRHPDMPRVMLFLISKAIERGEELRVIVKNLAKSGEYYWAITDFEPNFDAEGKIESFFAFRQAIPSSELVELIELYEILLRVEKSRGMGASLIYLNHYLQEEELNLDQFMENMSRPKSIFKQLFMSSFAPDCCKKAAYKKVA